MLKLLATLALMTAVGVRAYPGDYFNRYPTAGCYANSGQPAAMGGSNLYNSDTVQLYFTPALTYVENDCYEYTPSASYIVDLGSNDGLLSMVGSTGGTWSNPGPGTGGAPFPNGECTRDASVTYDGKSYTGYKMNNYHNPRGSNYTNTWTAPASGMVYLGGTRSASFNAGTATLELRLIAPGEECPLITAPPTQAAGVPVSDLCTDASTYSIIAPIADGVKTCFRQTPSYVEMNMEAPEGQWVAMGFSPVNTGMQQLDVYLFDGVTVQNRYSNSVGEPPIGETPGYHTVVSRALGGGVTQVTMRRPLPANGQRVDMTGAASYYIATATGPLTASGTPAVHTAKGYTANQVASNSVGENGVTVSLFSTEKKQWHGVLMIFSWVFLCPTAIVDARAGKGVLGPLWFELHRAFQTLAVILTIVGIIVINEDDTVDITDTSFDATQLHKKIGYAVLGLSIFQGLLGAGRKLIANHKAADEKHPHGPNRFIFNYLHWATGFVLVVLSLMNVYSGIGLNCPNDPVPGSKCDEGIGWVKTPVQKVYLAGVIFSVILYAVVALLQVVMPDNTALIDTVGRHTLALVSAMALSSAITMGSIVFDSDHE